MKGFLLKFYSKNMDFIPHLAIQRDEAYSTAEERSGYGHWFVFTRYNRDTPFKILNDLELSEEDLPIRLDLINYWFDIASD